MKRWAQKTLYGGRLWYLKWYLITWGMFFLLFKVLKTDENEKIVLI